MSFPYHRKSKKDTDSDEDGHGKKTKRRRIKAVVSESSSSEDGMDGSNPYKLHILHRLVLVHFGSLNAVLASMVLVFGSLIITKGA